MNKIEQLLQEHCPNGVEWKPLGEVFETRNGYTPSKANAEFWTNGTIPWFRMEDIRANGGVLKESIQYITTQAVKGKGLFEAGSIIMATTATIGEHALIIADSLANQQFTNFKVRKSLNKRLLSKFIYYYFFIIDEWCKRNVNVSNFPSVEMERLKRQQFPLPPLPVQQEIVRILDKFTTLEAELEAELEARKKQYEYYRDNLFTFGDEVEWKALGEVVKTTKNIKWQKNENTYDYIDLTSVCRETGNVLETLKIKADNAPSRAQKMVQLDDVIFATTRPSQMRIALIPKKFDGQIASTGYCVLRADKVNVLPKWIFFTLSTTEFKKFVAENQSGTAYPAISDSKLKEFKIPLPPLSEQQHIATILDKFDTLVNSISEGLPREIELRKKQYEYYREQLLSFPKT